MREVREFWDGCLVLGGGISDGHQIRAAEVLGSDLAYMGTRFIATRKSPAQEAYKQMIVDCRVKDVIYSDRFSGVFANFLLPSITRYGIDPETLPKKAPDMSGLANSEARTWKDIWSAGHGIATIHDVPSVAELVDRLAREYRGACTVPASLSTGCVLMRHVFVIEDEEHEVWLSRHGESYALHFGKRSAQRRAQLRRREQSNLLSVGAASSNVLVAADGDLVHVHIDGGRPPRSAILIRCSATGRHAAGGADDIAEAPMPGVVIAVHVAEGQSVTPGDTLIVIESMKLETAIKAWREGAVAAVHVAVGQAFQRGAPLLTLAPLTGA